MKERITNAERLRRLRTAEGLALERATHWWVWAATVRGDDVRQARLVKAASEREARRKVRRSITARPSLPSSQWREIYREVGLA